jgi:hypothetical protein
MAKKLYSDDRHNKVVEHIREPVREYKQHQGWKKEINSRSKKS